jgi:hypothetical protein
MKVKAESPMKPAHRLCACARPIVLFSLAFLSSTAGAQSCQTSGELDDAARTSISTAGQRVFDLAAKGDVATMRQNAIPILATDFGKIETSVKDHQPDLAGAQAIVKSSFLLDASGAAPDPHAEFLCGVFGKNGQTSGSAAFYFDNLPPGKYAVVLLDASSAKGKTMFSEILQQSGADWKLAGLYVKSAEIAGHDSSWFLDRAREYKAKGQLHDAWFYFVEAIDLVSRGMSFMSTLATDNLYDESQSLRPSDLPGGGKPVDLPAGTATHKLTAVFPEAVHDDLDLVVTYQIADASNTTQAFQDNTAVVKALVAKYPEVRQAFAGVVARAVDSGGRDFVTLIAMKDIK